MISDEEARKRDMHYAKLDTSQRIISCKGPHGSLSFDGYRKPDGSMCVTQDNFSALINHSKSNPNCKPVLVGAGHDIRTVMCSIKHISKGELR